MNALAVHAFSVECVFEFECELLSGIHKYAVPEIVGILRNRAVKLCLKK